MSEEQIAKKAQEMQHFTQVRVPHRRIFPKGDLQVGEHTVLVPMSPDAQILCWLIKHDKHDQLGLEAIRASTVTSLAATLFRMPRVGYTELGIVVDGDAANVWVAQQILENVADGIVDFVAESCPGTQDKILQEVQGLLEAADAEIEQAKTERASAETSVCDCDAPTSE